MRQIFYYPFCRCSRDDAGESAVKKTRQIIKIFNPQKKTDHRERHRENSVGKTDQAQVVLYCTHILFLFATGPMVCPAGVLLPVPTGQYPRQWKCSMNVSSPTVGSLCCHRIIAAHPVPPR